MSASYVSGEDLVALVRWEGPPDCRLLSVKTEGPVNLGVAAVAVCKIVCATPELHASHAAARALAISLMGAEVQRPTIMIRNDVPPKEPQS